MEHPLVQFMVLHWLLFGAIMHFQAMHVMQIVSTVSHIILGTQAVHHPGRAKSILCDSKYELIVAGGSLHKANRVTTGGKVLHSQVVMLSPLDAFRTPDLHFEGVADLG